MGPVREREKRRVEEQKTRLTCRHSTLPLGARPHRFVIFRPQRGARQNIRRIPHRSCLLIDSFQFSRRQARPSLQPIGMGLDAAFLRGLYHLFVAGAGIDP